MKKRNAIYLIIVILISLISGCVATGPKFSPIDANNKDISIIYIYRENEFKNMALSPEVFIRERQIGSMTNGGYFAIILHEGYYQISLRRKGWDGEAIQRVYTKPGDPIFLKVSTTFEKENRMVHRSFRLSQVSKEIGLSEISSTNNIETIDLVTK